MEKTLLYKDILELARQDDWFRYEVGIETNLLIILCLG